MSALPLKFVVVDHQRVAFPVTARFAQPFLDRRIERRTSVGRNDADLMRHFEHDQNVAGRLHDADAVVVVARHHGNRHAAGDAAVPAIEIVGAVEHGLPRLVAAVHLGIHFLAFRGERGEAPVRAARSSKTSVASPAVPESACGIAPDSNRLLRASAAFCAAANSSSVRNRRSPYFSGRWNGVAIRWLSGQMPCRSGSPHGVLGGVQVDCCARCRREHQADADPTHARIRLSSFEHIM